MDSKYLINLKDEELVNFINYMEKNVFKENFLDIVHKIAINLRVDAIDSNSEVKKDLSTIEDRIHWVYFYVKKELENRNEQSIAMQQNSMIS